MDDFVDQIAEESDDPDAGPLFPGAQEANRLQT